MKRMLAEQVARRGIVNSLVPHYLRDLANSILIWSDEDYTRINERMHHLGWGEIEVDYRLYELAKACIEKDQPSDFT